MKVKTFAKPIWKAEDFRWMCEDAQRSCDNISKTAKKMLCEDAEHCTGISYRLVAKTRL